MMLGDETLTIVRPGTPDYQGVPTGPPTQWDVPGCMVQPDGSQETNSGGDTAISGMAAWLPLPLPSGPGDLRPTDQIRRPLDGCLYAVDGRPGVWLHSHIQAQLRLVQGA